MKWSKKVKDLFKFRLHEPIIFASYRSFCKTELIIAHNRSEQFRRCSQCIISTYLPKQIIKSDYST